MTARTDQTRQAVSTRRRYRSKPVIGVVATVVALWLGLTAPAVSPAAPITPTQQTSSAVGVPTVSAPVVDQPFVFDRGRGGGGRR